MDIRVGLRSRGSMLRRGDLITVDFYKSDNEELQDWFRNNSDEGIGVKVVNFSNKDHLLWVQDCPFAIDPNICVKD